MRRLLPLLTLLTSCMVGPNFERHPMELPCDWSMTADENEPLSAWWLAFEDPLLEELIVDAAAYNLDILQAEERIKEVRGQRRVALSYAQPIVDADVSGSKNAFGGGPGAGGVGVTNFDVNQSLFFAGIDVFWEIDLFGGTRRSIQAATARLYSAEERRRGVMLAAFAELATNYLELRLLQKRISLLEESVATLTEIKELTEKRQEIGIDRMTSLYTIDADLETLKARLPPLQSYATAAALRISALTGRMPEELLPCLFAPASMPHLPEAVAAGIPCALLERRPDIRQAEEDLKAATAEIGVATADLFPTLTLFGNGGYQALTFGNVTDDKIVWAGGLDLLTPLFHGGAIRGNIAAARARAMQALYHYRDSVIRAFEEVERELAQFESNKITFTSLFNSTEELKKNASLTKEQFEVGIATRLQFLTAKQNALLKESESLDSQSSLFSSIVALYKALGGGWDSFSCGY